MLATGPAALRTSQWTSQSSRQIPNQRYFVTILETDYLYVATSAIIKPVYVGILKHYYCKGEKDERFTGSRISPPVSPGKFQKKIPSELANSFCFAFLKHLLTGNWRKLARGGMRIGEVLKLTPNDIDDRKLIIQEPKSGRGSEVVFIPRKLLLRLNDYVKDRKLNPVLGFPAIPQTIRFVPLLPAGRRASYHQRNRLMKNR